ncbi:sulfatase-like hydrolase/transferase [Occultella gossypii]|uniref:Sulfatase-like hydrolase/transferase n=1 Tax=Occultella gossypii TaxID=2800820 RepID=A0ABS7SC20_9MICO|nr:sulfatase-like hydrolase/transferase [Occultella gossypii]MBZ2197899.1 sulfatase-like hydrolase/transferase [Occultella gossypii]
MSAQQPHVLLVMTDQHRSGFTRRSGFALDTMPFCDALAADGVSFPNAYTTAPSCSPARASLLTGRWPSAHRVTQNSTAQHAWYDRDLLQILRSAGYRLSFAGKPHMHAGPDDFDHYAGPYFHVDGPQREPEHGAFDAWLEELDHGVAAEPTPFPLECQLPYRIVSDAIADVDAAADHAGPQFFWVSFPEPHNPYQVPDPYFSLFAESEVPERAHGPQAARDKGGHWLWLQELLERKRPGYDADWRRYVANYCGMLRLIDDQVRRFVEHARATLDGEILVVFVSDHGDYTGEFGLQRKGAGLPECLVRIPLFFSGAGVSGGQVREELVSIADVLPTLCALVGQPFPDGLQGRSLLPLLRGAPRPRGEFDSIYAERGFGGLTYRSDEHPPLHFSYDGRSLDSLNSVTQSGRSRMVVRDGRKLVVHSDGTGELYDLTTDAGEVTNLIDDPSHAAVRHDLLWCLTQWMLRVQDELPRGTYVPKTTEHNWMKSTG